MTNTVQGTTVGADAPNGGALSSRTIGHWALTIGAVGVVYGDIGTSPIYAFREAVLAAGDGQSAVSDSAILGVLSLILWALILIVTLKYVLLLTRADNKGEGGTLALMALAQRVLGRPRTILLVLGAVATALFFGDAILTPALSVLSAVEGLEIVTPTFASYVVPATIVILVALFLVQARGTTKIARFFGPIMAVWFVVLALGGVAAIARHPAVLAAFNPIQGISFMAEHSLIGFAILGAVFLAITGAEALYADLGHFGRRPIQTAWVGLVLPALALNYLGQGAAVLDDRSIMANPFFLLYPDWSRIPIVIFATAATVIASQAVITGAFSLSRQAIQLGLLPRLELRHTSETQAGQIYLPRINTLLLVGVVLLVLLFQSSGALAGAYGIAVSGTMIVTTILAFIVIRRMWNWTWYATALVLVPFAAVELTFLFANLMKVVQGGWVPLLLGAALVTVMLTWRKGSRLLSEKTRRKEVGVSDLIDRMAARPPIRVAGTAVFLTGDPKHVPTALLHNLKHYKVLHERNVILTVMTIDSPRATAEERLEIMPLGDVFWRMTVRYGFMESPNLTKAIAGARRLSFALDIMETSFFLSRRSVKPAHPSAMPLWQTKLFIVLARGADDASRYFHIPTDRVVEIGTQVLI